MVHSYEDYSQLNTVERQHIRETLEKLSLSSDELKLLMDISQNDPDSPVHQWALEKLGNYLNGIAQKDRDPSMRSWAKVQMGKLGIDVTANQTLTFGTPVEQGRVYERSQVLTQSLYMLSEGNGRAFLSSQTAQLMPDAVPLWSVLGAGILTLVAALLVVVLFVGYNQRPSALGAYAAIMLVVFLVDLIVLGSYLLRRSQYHKKRDRYARLSDTGQLVVGGVIQTRVEVPWSMTSPYRHFLAYSFQTPEGKTVANERLITSKQFERQPGKHSTLAILYVDDNDYEIL